MSNYLIGRSAAELQALAQELGESPFRGRQMAKWVYARWARDFEQMTDLSKAFRGQLTEAHKVYPVSLISKDVSDTGTSKYLLMLPDNQTVESVYIKHHDHITACLSSQVGCAVGCPFCATGWSGFSRNLTAAEIVAQYAWMAGDSPDRIGNIVYMGMGEPLLNYDEVLKSIRIIHDEIGVGYRHITISTSGVIPGIQRLKNEKIPVKLALSLHAPNDAMRDRLVPLNKRYPLAELLPVCHDYAESTGRRLTYEYILLSGVNDEVEHARQLIKLLRPFPGHVNLIPLNPPDVDTTVTASIPHIPPEARFEVPSKTRVLRFQQELEAAGITTTVRFSKGSQVAAACGQLRRRTVSDGQVSSGLRRGEHTKSYVKPRP